MADNNEEVKYSFQGDVKSLKQATETAIQLLDNYQKIVQQAVTAGKFSASAKSTQTFNNAINKTSKDVEKMVNKLKKVGDVKLPTGSEVSQAFGSTLATVSKQMDTISNATKITTKDLTKLRTELNATRSTLAGATPQVNKLVASEQEFQRVLGVVETKVQKVRTVLETMHGKVGSTFDPLAQRVKSLSSVFDAIKAKVQSFKDRAAIAFSRVSTLASTVASAFRRTSTEADKGDASSKRFAKALEKVSNVFSKLKGGANKTAVSFKNLGSVTGFLSKAFVALTGVKIGTWLADATKQSISYIENLNLFTVAMGDAIDEGKAFVATMQELYGMDPSNLMRYVGNFYQLATAIEMPDAAATNLSLILTKASNDIASLFNMDIETVFSNMASGMQGMSRAVRKYGMDIRTTTLQTEAAALGITEQVESMSEANRMGLRFLTMMKQASNASGDFARTIEAPANQLRIFKEQMTQLGRAIGNFFVGPLGTAISYVNGFIMALRTVLTFVAETLGILTGVSSSFDVGAADEEADAISGIGSAADSAAKKMKGLVAPFDELNILQESTADGGGAAFGSELMDPRIAAAIAEMEYKFEQIEMRANKVRNAILEFLGFEVDMGKIISWDPKALQLNLWNALPKTVQSVLQDLKPVVDAIGGLIRNLGNVFSELWENNIQPMLEKTGTALGPVLETLSTLWSHFAQIVAAAINLISSVWSTVLQPVFAGIFDAIGNLMEIIGVLWSTAIGPIISNVAAGLASLWESTILPIVLQLLQFIGGLIELVLALWNNVLAPVLEWLSGVLGPVIQVLVNLIWNIVSTLFRNIGNVIQGLLTALRGIIDFLVGVFTGDWDRAWKGIANVFIGITNAIISAFEFCVNAVIGLVNAMISHVYNAVVSLINTIIAALDDVAELIGFNINFRISAPPPQIPKQSWGRIPELARGGVVSSPTLAMIGEGSHSEAVLPLDDSPQMQDLIQKIADAVDRDDDPKPVEVRVFIGDREWDAFTYESSQRGKKLVGAQPIKEVRT